MDAPERGALTLVRLIGVMLVVASLFELGIYWAECSVPDHRVPIKAVPVAVRLIPALAGFVMLIRARAVAEWLADKLDL